MKIIVVRRDMEESGKNKNLELVQLKAANRLSQWTIDNEPKREKER